MQYLVRHLTRFVYTAPISESIMELRMQPLELERQRCLRFNVTTSERARMFAYRDHYGNAVHYFTLPGHHARLDVSVESAVDVVTPPALPEQTAADGWAAIDACATSEESEWLRPGPFTTRTTALDAFARSINLDRSADPVTTARRLAQVLCSQFAYAPRATRVDSPIDEALEARAGVCQDFSHIMLALLRSLGIPCRYVSGYIAPRESAKDRSSENATHAWVDVFLPGVGWTGVDPTNNTMAGDRHIAVAVGRDYSDVPPTRGVFKGGAGSELSVAVSVTRADAPIAVRELAPSVSWIVPPRPVSETFDHESQQQQQQQ